MRWPKQSWFPPLGKPGVGQPGVEARRPALSCSKSQAWELRRPGVHRRRQGWGRASETPGRLQLRPREPQGPGPVGSDLLSLGSKIPLPVVWLASAS